MKAMFSKELRTRVKGTNRGVIMLAMDSRKTIGRAKKDRHGAFTTEMPATPAMERLMYETLKKLLTMHSRNVKDSQ